MNLQARRISGSAFSAEDKLEVTFNSDNQPMASVVHTIELVSGINVTHGGGGLVGDYLHYKSVSLDADADGIIDYSSIEMALAQEVKGASVIKVQCRAISMVDNDANIDAYENWVNEPESEGKPETPPIQIDATIYETGEITLEWGDDTLV